MNFNIFRDYDIRGVYPGVLDEEIFYLIGRAMSDYLKVDLIAVGQDMCISSRSLFRALVDGITGQGVDVVDLGLISTEMHYFSSGKYEFPANAMISASYNSPEYNGLKILTRGNIALHSEYGFPEIRKLAEQNQFAESPEKGSVTRQNILQDWVNYALSVIDPTPLCPFQGMLDTVNDKGAPTWSKSIERLPISLISFHPTDPSKPANTLDLQQSVKYQQVDTGISLIVETGGERKPEKRSVWY